MYRNKAPREVVELARERAASERLQWEKDWVKHAWLKGSTDDVDRDESFVWQYLGGNPGGFDFTDRGNWPTDFQRMVNRLLPNYNPDAPLYDHLLEYCTRAVEKEDERAMLLMTCGPHRFTEEQLQGMCRSVADVPHGLAEFRTHALPTGIGHSPAWTYGYVSKRIKDACRGACPHGIPHTDPVAEDFNCMDWMRALTDAVMVAVAITITWIQPLYNVPSGHGLSLAAARKLKAVMATRREKWTIKNLGRYRAALWDDAEEAQKILHVGLEWGKAHTPSLLPFEDTGPMLLHRLDLTMSMGFLLKFAALKDTSQSFIDSLSPDMKEHLDTWCSYTTYSAWSSAIKERIRNEDRLIAEGGFPTYRTVPMNWSRKQCTLATRSWSRKPTKSFLTGAGEAQNSSTRFLWSSGSARSTFPGMAKT